MAPTSFPSTLPPPPPEAKATLKHSCYETLIKTVLIVTGLARIRLLSDTLAPDVIT